MLNANFGKGFIKNGKNDKVMTPPKIAKQIIDLYNVSGIILDPCKGEGAFYDNYPQNHL